MNYLPYTPDVEHADAEEQRVIDGIVEGMTEQSEKVEKREHHAVRASHAKSTGLLVGTLAVVEGLPPELAQGLFAQPKTFEVAVRFAQGPGETLGDRVSTHRGLSVKVFGVDGEKLGAAASNVQDFVFATGTTFPSGTAKGFLRDAKQIGLATPLPEGIKSAVSATMRGFNQLLHSFGTESPRADFFGHPFDHPLADSYFSQAPVRYGNHIAKLGLIPSTEAQSLLREWKLDPSRDEDGFRHAVINYFHNEPAVFELRVQLRTDAETQPIEDASVEWPIEQSPYRTVAFLRLPAQEAFSEARRHFFEELLQFTPANSLAAHRPLGSVMRARLQVYRALSDFRHRENGTAALDVTDPAQIPA